MRYFQTQGTVYPEDNYIVARRKELADFIMRVKRGRYIVLFAPRQTGKTTFFRTALEALTAEEPDYFPIQLNFEAYEDSDAAEFYAGLPEDIHVAIETVFQQRCRRISAPFAQFLEDTRFTNHLSMRRFFRQLSTFLNNQRVVLIMDEFDAIPREALRGFLHILRAIYLSGRVRCPHSVGIVGVKRLTQLSYDRTISPFNIQDEFHLPNFTLAQVQELLGQYTEEVGQAFAPEVIESLYKQTAGQPVLVNRLAQILTAELDIPKTEMIDTEHFSTAHRHLLRESNVNLQHLTTNIQRDARFARLLMKIASYDEGIRFNPRDEIMDELATYGVLAEGPDGMCEIVNPIYHYCILQTFEPAVNGLEAEYFPKDTGPETFREYLIPTGQIDMALLLDNFRDFIARAGFRILLVPQTPQEYVGQHLLFAYLDNFVRQVHGTLHLEVQTGRGRIDLMVHHRNQKYIVETKIWQGERSYQSGKQQLAAYLKLEGVTEGYYIVFDHRRTPEPRVETEMLEGNLTIRSYVIPVMQEPPSASSAGPAEP